MKGNDSLISGSRGVPKGDLAAFMRAEEALLRDLDRAMKPLSDVLKRGAERMGRLEQVKPLYSVARPDARSAGDFPSYLQSLASRTGALGSMAFHMEDAVGPASPALPAVSGSPAPRHDLAEGRTGARGSGKLGRGSPDAELPRYLDDLRTRLHALGFAGFNVRDILLARAAQASGGAAAAQREAPAELRSLMAFGGPEDIRAYLEALTARVSSFRHAAALLEQALKDGADLLSRLDATAAPPPPVFVVAPPPPPPPPPRPAAVAAAPVPVAVVLPRPRIIDVAGVPRRGRLLLLRESFWSSRRLQWLVLAAALIALLIAFGTAWYWSQGYAQQSFARATVTRMRNASSYRAAGVDFVRDATTTTEIREFFDFVQPDSVSTHYQTVARQTGSDIFSRVECGDKDILVLSATRYQKCNDKDTTVKGWVVDQYDPKVFDTSLFEPWQRFAWCNQIKEEDESVLVSGVPTRVFSCPVPTAREATVIFELKGTGTLADKSLTEKQRKELQKKFIEETNVDITVWVRETDGFIGRFAMVKTSPNASGAIVTETVDIRYTDFNLVPPIPPPDTAQKIESTEPTEEKNFRPSVAIVGSSVFYVEVADDDFTRQQGLSNRPPGTFPQDRGILFVFPEEGRQRFWMKDVRMSLDIIFLDKNRKIVDLTTMQAPAVGVSDNQLPIYESRQPAKWVLEINAGIAQRDGIRIGQTVDFQ